MLVKLLVELCVGDLNCNNTTSMTKSYNPSSPVYFTFTHLGFFYITVMSVPLKGLFLKDAYSMQKIPSCGEWSMVEGSVIRQVIQPRQARCLSLHLC